VGRGGAVGVFLEDADDLKEREDASEKREGGRNEGKRERGRERRRRYLIVVCIVRCGLMIAVVGGSYRRARFASRPSRFRTSRPTEDSLVDPVHRLSGKRRKRNQTSASPKFLILLFTRESNERRERERKQLT